MHSFLFPEDLNGLPVQSSQQPHASRKSRPASRTTTESPKMPARAPPTTPQHGRPTPPPPTHAPPPIPSIKAKAVVSVTELSIPNRQPEPGLQRTKSKWSQRQIPSIISLRDRREAKAETRAAEATAAIDVLLPPLSPIVDEEFWRTGRHEQAYQWTHTAPAALLKVKAKHHLLAFRSAIKQLNQDTLEGLRKPIGSLSMDPSGEECGDLLDRLSSTVQVVTVKTPGAGSRCYHIQIALLAAVSVKLSKHCSSYIDDGMDGLLILNVSDDAFRMFLAWLLHCDFRDDIDELKPSQLAFAQTWNFGAKYDIPAFQDAVMHRVVSYLKDDIVEPDTVLEAYGVAERGTLLQTAFIMQLAYDMREGSATAWPRETFIKHGLEKVPDLYLDLTEQTCPYGGGDFKSLPPLELADVLLKDASK